MKRHRTCLLSWCLTGSAFQQNWESCCFTNAGTGLDQLKVGRISLTLHKGQYLVLNRLDILNRPGNGLHHVGQAACVWGHRVGAYAKPFKKYLGPLATAERLGYSYPAGLEEMTDSAFPPLGIRDIQLTSSQKVPVLELVFCGDIDTDEVPALQFPGYLCRIKRVRFSDTVLVLCEMSAALTIILWTPACTRA